MNQDQRKLTHGEQSSSPVINGDENFTEIDVEQTLHQHREELNVLAEARCPDV